MANKKKKQNRFLKHMKSLGFTNRLGIYILLFLAFGMAGGFYLSILSIKNSYLGQLLAWTVVFTPLGAISSAVLGQIVRKNRDENTSETGMGIAFAAAQANGFVRDYDNYTNPIDETTDDDLSGDAPTI